jgi:hypothetical protein
LIRGGFVLIRVIADNVRTLSAVLDVDSIPLVGQMLVLEGHRVVVRAVLETSRESTIAAYVYVSQRDAAS